MASRKRATPGYEPALGRPDPNAAPQFQTSATHYPHAQGPVCGFRPTPTDASAYDALAPTCPVCATYLAAATAVTARQNPIAHARTLARRAAAAKPTT